MGLDNAIYFVSIILLLPMLVGAALVFFALQWLRVIPSGIASVPAYVLIVLGAYALLFMAASIETFVIRPHRLQTNHLSRAFGAPLTLRNYQNSGFQDPEDEWVYALKPEVVDELRRQCLKEFSGGGRCYLFGYEDSRANTSIWLSENNLHILDGLH